MFDKYLIIALGLSIAWHSLACILFKLTEPYHLKLQPHRFFNVELMSLPSFPSVGTHSRGLGYQRFIGRKRFGLPHRSDPLLPIDEYELDFFKREVVDMQPAADTALLRSQLPLHFDVQFENDQPLEPVPSAMARQIAPQQGDTVDVDYSESVRIIMSLDGAYSNREILSRQLPQKIAGNGSIVLTMGVDAVGGVKFVILRRSSGSIDEDQRIIALLRDWRFAPKKTIGRAEFELEWGGLAFITVKNRSKQ